MTDAVDHPPHYRGANGVEAIDVVEGFELNFRLGNSVTYILRADRKGEPLKDLKKARWYLDREIGKREAPQAGELKELAEYGLCYLATPYSKYPDGIESAFKDAAALAGKLLRCGVKVYSPISHTHPIAVNAHIDPLDHAIWLPFDRAMMDRCEVLLVAKMRGWERSHGIAHEIEVFTEAHKPVLYLDPASLQASAVVVVKV